MRKLVTTAANSACRTKVKPATNDGYCGCLSLFAVAVNLTAVADASALKKKSVTCFCGFSERMN